MLSGDRGRAEWPEGLGPDGSRPPVSLFIASTGTVLRPAQHGRKGTAGIHRIFLKKNPIQACWESDLEVRFPPFRPHCAGLRTVAVCAIHKDTGGRSRLAPGLPATPPFRARVVITDSLNR